MQKEVKYRSMVRATTGRVAADGDLEISYNLINEDGALRPVAKAGVVVALPEGKRLLYVHQPPSGDSDMYIMADGAKLYFYKHGEALSEVGSYELAGAEVYQVVGIGNMMIAATSGGLLHFLYREGEYVALGSKPAMPRISFGVRLAGKLGKRTKYYDILRDFVEDHRSTNKDDKAELKKLTDAVYGHLLSEVAEVTGKGYFYQPFYVRYALRLYDGSYVQHSAPVLMLCTTHAPMVQVDMGSVESGTDSDHGNVWSTLAVPYFKLEKRVVSAGGLSAWKDVVQSVDVFVSAPVYTYDQGKDLTAGEPSKDLMWYAGRLPGKEYTDQSGAQNVRYFVGHYKERADGESCDQYVTTEELKGAYYWNIGKHASFEENLSAVGNFYKVAEIALEDLVEESEYSDLEIKDKELDNLTTREALEDDYMSHCELVAGSVFAYNSRLHLCDVKYELGKPMAIDSSAAATKNAASRGRVSITVWTKSGGRRRSVKTEYADDSYYLSGADAEFPRYLYYPDSTAYAMRIVSGGVVWQVALKAHDRLNGAYYMPKEVLGVESYTASNCDEEFGSEVELRNKIYVSEVDNPMVFAAKSVVSVGADRVIALSAATKALSQGQFGQHPLYAFTNEGIWALEVGSSGAYIARQPISRDVLLNNDRSSITQVDNGVLFAAPRGIMLLSGASSQCISEVLDRGDMIAEEVGVAAKVGMTMPEVVALTDFLQGAKIIYDYPRRHIIVYNAAYDYSLVYSLRSSMWGMCGAYLQYNVNAYPYSKAVDVRNNLVEFSPQGEYDSEVSLLTRPIKMGAEDVYKSINAVVHHVDGEDVRSVVFGTRDYRRYRVIAARGGCRIGGLCGTGYKAFRLALSASLGAGGSIDSSAFTITPKQTNKLR